ncbi:GAF domain-containing protein [Lactobacillus acidophilus]|uniref:GAF domain-containing protein n=1 Tax=Lactobacillus acidophilus TaxID=1579 RepID=UPI000F763824|nr:GAF domain-containing protein [Lactobacillus acidophilus]AZN75934.1 histidine kinase [Lactobacillus acidophilus]MCT3603324.1 GAF domain-containing protein [Lactobacillus acidophilus]MCT3622767.1 GAF domain-containing protein [Lactobacillus acidophilus]
MAATTKEDYELLVQQAQALIANESDWIANTANLSALLFNSLSDVNFAGVYRLENGELILGPFQGMPACVHIPVGRGVCGVAAKTQITQIVPNVHEFAGHIACDSASNSEIVIPIFKNRKLWGVFDFDSTKLDNFDDMDKKYLTRIAKMVFA